MRDRGGRSVANAVAGDRSGEVFMTVYALNIGSSFDYTTVAYSSTGERLWTNAYNGPLNNFDDYGLAVVTDNSDNVVVTGFLRASGAFPYNDQAQRQPPLSAGRAQGRRPNHPRLANGKRGGCSLRRSA